MKLFRNFSAGLLVVFVWIFVAATAEAKKPEKPGGGHGGDDHGDPPARYSAQFITGPDGTLGGFDFSTQILTKNNRGNSYRNNEAIDMDRTGHDGSFDSGTWDNVFSTCPAFDLPGPIEWMSVSAKWSIDNSGARGSGQPGSPVLVSLRDTAVDGYPDIEVDLHLVGTLPAPFPTEAGQPAVLIELYEFWFYVNAHGNEDCKYRGPLDPQSSWLEMAWYGE